MANTWLKYINHKTPPMKALFANNTVIIICYSVISVAVINAINKSNLGEERAYYLILHTQVTTPHWGGQARNSSRNGSRIHRETVLTGSLYGSWSSNFLYSLGPPATLVQPKGGKTLPHQLAIAHAHGPILRKQFFNWGCCPAGMSHCRPKGALISPESTMSLLQWGQMPIPPPKDKG